MDGIPVYVSVVFILTTLATVGLFFFAARNADRNPLRILLVVVPAALGLTAILAANGFYASNAVRVPLFAVLPAVLVIAGYFLFFRESYIARLKLSDLTFLHVIRIPVEMVLLWLSMAGAVPAIMTFEGRNFDILSGILSLIVWVIAFRRGRVNRPLLIAYNILGLVLLANIVAIAVMALPTPMQQLALDQPNKAVLYLPFVWLPAVVVPIVLFSHLAALWKLAVNKLS